jgi:hypothetical protein
MVTALGARQTIDPIRQNIYVFMIRQITPRQSGLSYASKQTNPSPLVMYNKRDRK